MCLLLWLLLHLLLLLPQGAIAKKAIMLRRFQFGSNGIKTCQFLRRHCHCHRCIHLRRSLLLLLLLCGLLGVHTQRLGNRRRHKFISLELHIHGSGTSIAHPSPHAGNIPKPAPAFPLDTPVLLEMHASCEPPVFHLGDRHHLDREQLLLHSSF
jgi:hypothetical protein